MQKVSVENKAVIEPKAVDPAVQIRATRLADLRADLARARRQREVVIASGKRDNGAVFRLKDIDAWILRDETELRELENKGVTA